jgi:hypothetical protein
MQPRSIAKDAMDNRTPLRLLAAVGLRMGVFEDDVKNEERLAYQP